MTTALPRTIVALLVTMLIVAACASEAGSTWTFAPVEPPASEAPTESAESTESAEPSGSEAPAESAEPSGSEAPTESAEPSGSVPPAGEARVIELQATATLRFADANGDQLNDIPVTPGETVLFRVDNTAGFEHNFYIGPDDQLSVPNGTTDVGIPTWTSGVEELEWVVPADINGLMFGCTVPGHYPAGMKGTFSVSP